MTGVGWRTSGLTMLGILGGLLLVGELSGQEAMEDPDPFQHESTGPDLLQHAPNAPAPHPREATGPGSLLSETVGGALLQEEVTEPGSLQPEVEEEEEITPAGAFLRSVLIPGWGHAAVEAHVRGGFYFLAQAANGWMLFKTGTRLEAARNRVRMWEDVAREEFREAGVTSPDSLRLLVSEDPRVEDAGGLVDLRSEQMEDWIALTVFFTFLGGADAFVAAHLRDFPVPLEVDVLGEPRGRTEIRFSTPARLPWR